MTDKLELSIALARNENTQAILDGEIAPDGIKLYPTALHPSEMFWRQLKFAEFDVSEMSMSSLTIATSQAATAWVAIPVFTTREFFHLRALVRVASGINKPEDLKGKRVGVPEYQQTAAIWGRGVLQHEFGVHPRDIEWHMERTPRNEPRRRDRLQGAGRRHGAPDSGEHQHRRDDGEGRARRDAALSRQPNNLVDRSRIDLSKDGGGAASGRCSIRRPRARDYFKKTGIYQINHGMVIRRSIHERYPWAALNIFNAFKKARAAGARKRATPRCTATTSPA